MRTLYQHWFVSRQKRKLTSILPALAAFSDVCVGHVWSGNDELQLKFEDELGRRDITAHGSLRARKSKSGGGGARTLFKQMKDLGLIFTEDENKKCRLTLTGEDLIKGNITFVSAMRTQLQKYQYPSAASWKGSGGIDHSFRVHPFQFLFRLLREPKLEGYLTQKEAAGIVIHYADSDSNACFERIVEMILRYRAGDLSEFIPDTSKKTYGDIANTMFNYLSLCQYTDRGTNVIMVRHGMEQAVDDFIQDNPKFIANPDLPENYIRAYGRGSYAKDLRRFDRENIPSQKELNEARIREEYVLLALRTPIKEVTPDVIAHITEKTGIDAGVVEKFLRKNYPDGNTDDFFASYRELAHMGRDGAEDFELATVELFRKIFGMKAEHVGQIGNTPDVFVESDEAGYAGIIDNKAYHRDYCISGNHLRVMEDEYIPNYKKYGHTDNPLAFYSYIAGSFGTNMNIWLARITKDTGVNGSAMPVDLLIDFAQDYQNGGYTHEDIRRVFSLNREVKLSDITHG